MSNQVQLPQEPIQVENRVGNVFKRGSGAEIEVTSPYSGQLVGRTWESTSTDVEDAVAASKTAFEKWRSTPIKERTQVMFRFREALLSSIDEISHVISSENGKTLGEAKAGLMKGIEVLEFALSLQHLDMGGRMEVSRGVFCEYRREPLGVVASITPFNFPAMVPMWTIPIVLTLGNAMIWKPSEKTPLTSKWIVEALQKAGLPDGVFSVVQGGRTAVESILDHPDVRAVSFVGSTKVAELVYERGTKNHKRVLALGGAKNHIVLLPDADPDLTGAGISDSFTGCAGQRCMAASVLLAVGEVDPLIEKIKERASSQKLGETMGAIITREQVEFLNQAIDRAEKAGAKILLDGRQFKAPQNWEGGFWLGPTILDQVQPDSEASKLELFGPILSIVRCKNISEAMEIENANPYGNACSVFTRTGAFADLVAKRAKAAMIGVNIGVPVPREPFSFGGLNVSKFGHGDITGQHSLDFWSDIKKITTKWEPQKDNNWMS